MKKLIKYLLLLASCVILGTPTVTAADPVRDTTCHRVSGYYEGISISLLSAIPGVAVPHDMRVTSQDDLTKTSMVNVSVDDVRTLTWNPGLHRYNCAGWRRVVFQIYPDAPAIQLEDNGTRIRMLEWGTREGNLQFPANIRVTRGDTIWFHAILRKDRSVTMVATSYGYSAGSDSIDCPASVIMPTVIILPGCTSPPADPENDGLAENKSVLAFDFNKTEVLGLRNLG